jgi:hypothetical protein
MPADVAAWAALGVSVLGTLPRLVSTLTRSTTESRRMDVARFEALYDKQDRLIARLEDRCDELEQQLAAIRGPKAK